MTPSPSLRAGRQWLRTQTGRGVRIAVLDSGVETRHPSLDQLRLRDDLALHWARAGWRVQRGRGRDLFGHGTAVAHIIRQLAPEAELGSFRVLGAGLHSRTAMICQGARLALQLGYHILNCSFGCGRLDHVLFYKQWIDQAYLSGCHVVAAGNQLHDGQPEWPGHFPTVITVNAIPAERVEEFYYRTGTLVEFQARGVELDVAWAGGSHKQVTGSSFAAAHLTGLLARLLSGCPSLHPLQAKTLLHRLARSEE